MDIRQLRNATLSVAIGPHRLIVDPMLSPPGALPGFKVFGGGRRANPLVPLPVEAAAALAEATGVVVTHEHPDHLDGPGLRWAKERGLPVWTNGMDAPSLTRKGVDARVLAPGALGMDVEIVRSRHGRGLLGFLMGPVAGYFLAAPDEPSLYLIGDSVLTDSVIEAIERLQPDVIVAPAGSANMGLGGEILFTVDELVQLTRLAKGRVFLNHLEALDHCPTTRASLRDRLRAEGLTDRVVIPEDGERVTFERTPHAPAKSRPREQEHPSFQKWLTAPFAGT